MSDTLRELRDALRAFAAERYWDQFHSPRNLAAALSVGAAELLEPFQWLTDEQSRTLSPETRAAVEQDLADVLLYLVRLADKLGVDLEAAAHAKMARNAAKYPVEKSRGSSRKYARRFVKEGAAVALFDINDLNLENAKKELLTLQPGAEILLVHCDITSEAEVVQSVKTTADHFGRLNIAVNNAGVSISIPSEECTLEQWNWVMNINCTGSFLISREAIKVFKTQADGGVLVYINSDNALKPSKHFLAYNASKAAQLHLARTIANEFGPYHIRANSILPGAVFGGSAMWTPERVSW